MWTPVALKEVCWHLYEKIKKSMKKKYTTLYVIEIKYACEYWY